jgi:uncharacterized protein YkwD
MKLHFWIITLASCIISLSLFSSAFAQDDFDSVRVENAWVEWTNTERSLVWVPAIASHSGLAQTAKVWSIESEKRGEMSHKRTNRSSYYDYKEIEKWFGNQGFKFKNVSRKTFSESIGYGTVKCPKEGDCTDALITATKSTWKFFMSEKWKQYAPHYKAIVMSEFRLMGVGVELDKSSKRYYITVHYATEVVGDKIAVTPKVTPKTVKVSMSLEEDPFDIMLPASLTRKIEVARK